MSIDRQTRNRIDRYIDRPNTGRALPFNARSRAARPNDSGPWASDTVAHLADPENASPVGNPTAGAREGNGTPVFLDERVYFGQIEAAEKEQLTEELDQFLMANTWPSDAASQAQIGKAFVEHIKRAVPRISQALQKAKQGKYDAVYITGLPVDLNCARIVLLAMTQILGEPFNYSCQNGGELVMELRPIEGSVGNTNSTRDDFALHTDDAAVPDAARTEFICLYGIVNPPNTLTGFAPTIDALRDLRASTSFVNALVDVLKERRFRFRFPTSFNFEEELWSGPCSVIKVNDDGNAETRFPSFAVKPVRDDDFIAHAAIAVFRASLELNVFEVPIDQGCFLAFNNSRGVHKRGAIGKGERLVLRAYSIQSLDFLREVTGEPGPIFSIDPIVEIAGT
ncbi:MAG: hypothetical protein GKS00_24685 [Alphaproteobacteria bacterium]|nr:hypothetical protein [Alphaproteobacteria bacterium]